MAELAEPGGTGGVSSKTDPDKYKCTICDKCFKKIYNLKRHLKQVHGESDASWVTLPFDSCGLACDLCPTASFAFHGGLLRHFEAKHEFVARRDTEPDEEMPSTTREATGFTLDDEPQSLLNDIQQSIEVGMQTTQPNSEDEIRLALSRLSESLSKKKLTSSSSSLVLKYLTKIQEILDSAPDKTSPPDETSLKPRVIPHNEKMGKQARYFSTKKKRPSSGPMHGKPPTRLEQQRIMEGLVARGVAAGRAASAQLPVDVPSMSVLALKDHDYFAYQ